MFRLLAIMLFTDLQVGQIVEQLRKEGVLEHTVIFFITDHGVSHARGKQFLYDEGTHISSVCSEKWKYIRNFLPLRSYLQPNGYLSKGKDPEL